MTLREWITKGDSGTLFTEDVFRMADKLGIDMRESRSHYSRTELRQREKQLIFKLDLVVSMFERKFGLDEEF